MNVVEDGRLEQLLKNADAAIPPPACGDLVAGARRLRSRRRNGRIALGCIALVLAAIAIRPSRPDRFAQVSNLKSQISNLDFEDQLATRTLDELLKSEHRLAVEDKLRRLEARSIDLGQEREETAVTLLEGAANSSEPAAVFRQVATYFPDTGAGIVARRQLAND